MDVPYWVLWSWPLWPGWAMAAAGCALTWQRERQSAALCCLIVGCQLMVLAIVFSFWNWIGPTCCGGYPPWPPPNFLSIVWAPMALLGLPVVLRTRWREIDPAVRRMVGLLVVTAADGFLVTFGIFLLLVTPFSTYRGIVEWLGIG